MKGILFDIQKASTVDGPGLRTSVFFKGCNLRCAWCHNPESQSMQRERMVYEDRCTHCGLCRQVCPHQTETCDLCGMCARYCPQEARKVAGEEYSAEDVFRVIASDARYYAMSGGGATFSGGECMLQLDFLCELLQMCRDNGIHTAIDTAGEVPFEAFERVLPLADMFLYDVKVMDSALHKKVTGVGNERILDNLSRLLRMGKRVWIRVPVVPAVNDNAQNMLALRTFLTENGYPEKVELLPYHRMGEAKYKALHRPFTAYDVPDAQTMEKLQKLVER